MATREREQIKASLERKGFQSKLGKTDHWRFIYFTQTGLKTPINTKISRGTKYKMISDNLLGEMAKQCKLSKNDFLDLVDCPLSREQYEQILEAKGISI